MAAKKATTRKAPSAKQLAARKRFALAAKARSKKAMVRKSNPSRYRVLDGDLIVAKGSSPSAALSAARRKYQGTGASPRFTIERFDLKSRQWVTSLTGQTKQNPKTYRRKVNGEYQDLVIAGTARRGSKGWRVGGKEVPYGKGIVPVKAGHYLDKATGTIFMKRARNVAAGAYYDGAFHPFRSSADYDPAIAGETGGKPQRTRSKKKKAAVKKAIRTASDRKATKQRKATTSRLASRSLFRSVPLKPARKGNPLRVHGYRITLEKRMTGGVLRGFKKAGWHVYVHEASGKHQVGHLVPVTGGLSARHNDGSEEGVFRTQKSALSALISSLKQHGALERPRRNPSESSAKAIENRRDFAGQFNGFKSIYAAAGTPEGLSRLGILAELVLIDKSRLSLREQSVLFLAQDTDHKLHIVSSKPGPMVDNKPGSYGEIKTVEYIESKPHLGSSEKIQWVHKMGEVSGKRPSLIVDSNGQLRLKGGDYSINWRGIIN